MSEHELYHFGVKGMKWGVRKNRNKSGANAHKRSGDNTLTDEQKTAKRKKIIKAGAVVAGTILATYGAVKLAKFAEERRTARLEKRTKNFIEAFKYLDAVEKGEVRAYGHSDDVRRHHDQVVRAIMKRKDPDPLRRYTGVTIIRRRK